MKGREERRGQSHLTAVLGGDSTVGDYYSTDVMFLIAGLLYYLCIILYCRREKGGGGEKGGGRRAAKIITQLLIVHGGMCIPVLN